MLPASYEAGKYAFTDPHAVLAAMGAVLVYTPAQAKALVARLWKADYVALDTEFDGRDEEGCARALAMKDESFPGKSNLVTSQYAWREGGKLCQAWVDCRSPHVLDILKPWLESDRPKIYHNYSAEYHTFANHGIWLGGFFFDTMQGSRLEDPERESHSLDGDDGLAVQLLGKPYGSRPGTKTALGTHKIGKKGAPVKTIELLPMTLLVEDDEMLPFQQVYALQDSTDTYELFEIIPERLSALPVFGREDGLLGFFNEWQARFLPLLARIERRGMVADVAYARELVDGIYLAEIAELETEFLEWAQCSVNLGSNQQKSHLFYGQGWEVTSKDKNAPEILGHDLPIPPARNKAEQKKWESSGQIRVDSEAITWLLEHGELTDGDARALVVYQEHQKISKLVTSFLEPITNHALPRHATGLREYVEDSPYLYVHTALYLGPRTGRLASRKPNLQNIAQRGRGSLVRHVYTCEADEALIVADYSQLELRILGYFLLALFGDPSLSNALVGGDLHENTRSKISAYLGFDIIREIAKNVNFGMVYGITAQKIARSYGLTVAQAEAILDAYFATYPGVKKYMDWAIASCRKTGAARTLFGRYRFLPDITSDYARWRQAAERQAMNTPIQGSAADIVMAAMLLIEEDEELRDLGYEQRLQVHDEIIGVCPMANRIRVLERKIELMEAAVSPELLCGVRLPVDGHWGTTWAEAKKGEMFTHAKAA